jgi:hypothetical protein
MAIAGRVHAFEFHRPNSRTPPAAPQPAPVMDRYNGLRPASNSYNTSHQRRAATKRTTPHADRINTIHRSRVTPKDRFVGMDNKNLSESSALAAVLGAEDGGESNFRMDDKFIGTESGLP